MPGFLSKCKTECDREAVQAPWSMRWGHPSPPPKKKKKCSPYCPELPLKLSTNRLNVGRPVCTAAGPTEGGHLAGFCRRGTTKKVCRSAPDQYSEPMAETADWSVLAEGASYCQNKIAQQGISLYQHRIVSTAAPLELSVFFFSPAGLNEKKNF